MRWAVPHHWRIFLANSFGLLDSIWMRAVSSSDRIFRSRAPNLGVLCTPDRPPPFVWSLAGEVGRAVLSRTDEEEDEGDNREERREGETRKLKERKQPDVKNDAEISTSFNAAASVPPYPPSHLPFVEG